MFRIFTLSLQSQPENNLPTRMAIFAHISPLRMYCSPDVINQAELKQAVYYREALSVLRCDAMYSARKVPRLLSTSSLFLHLPCGQPFSPKDCRSRPFRNSVMIFNQNARQNIPEDYYIQQ